MHCLSFLHRSMRSTGVPVRSGESRAGLLLDRRILCSFRSGEALRQVCGEIQSRNAEHEVDRRSSPAARHLLRSTAKRDLCLLLDTLARRRCSVAWRRSTSSSPRTPSVPCATFSLSRRRSSGRSIDTAISISTSNARETFASNGPFKSSRNYGIRPSTVSASECSASLSSSLTVG